MYNAFAFVDGQFQVPLQNFISTGTSNIANWVVGPLTVALTLYVMLYGFLILRGSVQEPIMDFAFRAMKLGIILMLVRNAGEYQTYVADLFFESLPHEISQALNVGTAPTASTFDALLDKGQKTAYEVWARASWPVDIVTGIGGMLVIGASFAVAAIGYIVSLYARLALAIILAIGPIFIALAMFQATRRFTEAWPARQFCHPAGSGDGHRIAVDRHDRFHLPCHRGLFRRADASDRALRRLPCSALCLLPASRNRLGTRCRRRVTHLWLRRGSGCA